MVVEYDYPNIDWDTLYRHRQRTTQHVMSEGNFDAILVRCRDNIRYTTDYRIIEHPEMNNEEFAAIVLRDGTSYVFQPWYPESMAGRKKRMPWIKEIIHIPSWTPSPVTSNIWATKLSDKLHELECKRVGVDYLSFELFDKLRLASKSMQFDSIFVPMLEARMVKSEEEIKLLEVTAAACDAGAKAGLEMMREGISEYEVVGEMCNKSMRCGAEAVSHCFLVSGARAFADLNPSNRRLQRGDTAVYDFGVYGRGGYTSDIARTGVVGKTRKEFYDCYSVLYEAHMKAVQAAKPGTKASDIDTLCREPLVEAGYPDSPYANGHGMGLRTAELPQVDKPEFMAKDYMLKSGMVICIEPETCLDELPLKIENCVVVTETGGKILNKTEYLI
jgi:Xaa-Pro dipeptidase